MDARQARALRRLGCAAGLALWVAPAAMADARDCSRHDVSGFSICVPSSWVLVKDGVDSAAGQFSGAGVRVRYDFGLHADPMPIPAGASDASEQAVVIDGRPARQVRYTAALGAQGPMQYWGVHVAQVGTGSMGRLRLTVRAYAQDRSAFAEVEAAVATIRFAR